MITLAEWLCKNPLSTIEIDCCITVKLKILDGKCKMSREDKRFMAALYEATKHRESQVFQNDIHRFIAAVGQERDEAQCMAVYEKRLMAETMISRPVMKAFKARIRTAGLYQTEIKAY
ncbi:hypothetical protein SAMN02745866_01817 [Alteromonadaceae bacterium Bs31]|nr:hypothetical protein SAMN02745866_01817 [Alteromonadaceae bacterium Bs31]